MRNCASGRQNVSEAVKRVEMARIGGEQKSAEVDEDDEEEDEKKDELKRLEHGDGREL